MTGGANQKHKEVLQVCKGREKQHPQTIPMVQTRSPVTSGELESLDVPEKPKQGGTSTGTFNSILRNHMMEQVKFRTLQRPYAQPREIHWPMNTHEFNMNASKRNAKTLAPPPLPPINNA